MPFDNGYADTEKQMVGRLLLEYFKSAVESNSELNVGEVFNTVQQIVSDPDLSVRLDLVEQLPHVAIMCQETPQLFGDAVSRYIIGIILKYLRDSENQVRQTAQAALITIVERGILSKKQLEYEVCPVILNMTYMQIEFLNTAIVVNGTGRLIGKFERDPIVKLVVACCFLTFISQPFLTSWVAVFPSNSTNFRISRKKSCHRLYGWNMTLGLYKDKIDCSTRQSGCDVIPRLISQPALMSGTLISKLGPYMGSELLERIFLDRYLTLCEDDKFFVRKVCASYLGEICANISKGVVYKKLFPKYINLCMDEIWGVRKACVDVMLSVASCVTIYEYRMVLSKLLATQLNDESKWVRTSAYQILGPFISIFATQFTGLRYNQFGDFVMSHNQGSVLRQNIIPSTKNESAVGPNDIFATPLEREIGILGIDMYASKKGKVPSHYNMPPGKNKNDNILFQATNWLGDIAESEEQTDSSGDTSGDDVNKFNPFQYYYIPPEMPLDLELVHPSGKPSSEEEEAFEEVFDDAFTETLNDETTQVLPRVAAESTWQQETQSLPQSIDENIDSDKGSFGDSSNFEDKKVARNTKFQDSYRAKRKIRDSIASNFYSSFETGEIITPISLSQAKNTDEIVPQFLINFFVSMVDPSPLTDIGTEIHYQCAFYFPAVVMTLGKRNWYQLKTAYQALAGAVQWKVRGTLASSIHEIALILGEELAGSDLMPIYDGFIKDLDEVRIGALKHLSTFLKVLRPTDRQQYLPKLSDFLVTDTEWNWKFREEFANQLLQAIHLYKPEDISEHIAPLALQLLQDKVAAVRQVALSLITKITMYLGTEEPLAIALIQELNHQLIFNKWTCRQTYALICSQLIDTDSINLEIFAKEMLPHLLNLSTDKVPNVRLVVARTLAEDVLSLAQDGLDVDLTKSIIEKLKQDPDRDVRALAGRYGLNEESNQNIRHTFPLDAF